MAEATQPPLTRDDAIALRIVELTVRRDSMLRFVMNDKLRKEAGIVDKQIDALRELLTERNVTRYGVEVVASLPGMLETKTQDNACEHCLIKTTVMVDARFNINFCPSCGEGIFQ